MLGARYAPRFASQPWNYGCPGHETADKVLLYAAPPGTGKIVHRRRLFGAEQRGFTEQVTCKGNLVPLEDLRGAAADWWMRFQPPFEAHMGRAAEKLKLPNKFLAVHIRGGDKLVSEWRGA